MPRPESADQSADLVNRDLITVRAALRLPALRVGAPEVLAGHRNLDRPVRWVHVGEVPNIAHLLKGGELLLMTGIAAPHGAAQQRRYIQELSGCGVAALVVELGRHFARLPAAIVSEAEKLGLPLVALKHEIAFIEVTEQVHTNILGRQYAALRRSEDVHRRLTKLMIDGAGISEIITELAATIANPVALEKAGQGVLYHAIYRTPSADVLATLQDLTYDRGGTETATLRVPVPSTGDAVWGTLIALAIDSPLDEPTRIAMERAVELIALALAREHAERVLETREHGELLADIAAGRLTASDCAYRAQALGFSPNGGSLLMPLAVNAHTRTHNTPAELSASVPATTTAAWQGVWSTVATEVRSRGTPILIGSRARDDDTLILAALATPTRRRALADLIASTIRTAAGRQLGTAVPAMTVVAVGQLTQSWAQLPAALNQAAQAAALAHPNPTQPWVDATTPSVDRLLANLRGHPALEAFIDQRLHALVRHDQQRSAKLLPTLQVLLEHAGHKTETARALHLERQSLYARIRRIEAILNEGLDDPDTRLGLQLALRARRQRRESYDNY